MTRCRCNRGRQLGDVEWHFYAGLTPEAERAISQLDETVSAALESVDGYGDCEVASKTWHDALRAVGIMSTVVKGSYAGEYGRIGHWWLEVGDGLFDPTAQQFFDLGEGEPDEFRYYKHKRQPRQPG